ncbi:D-tagatose 3-epimerase [Caulifigura coniformis]|uniref:D-tagatose 3-epimerase n=1 Tax=Caulifigura coniformis TaxID=2527983 RepID=A0A517SFS3_9PLAN|nr:sugar phosphate isomerase/epimerase family protein [Caulifigura coniformis]QDT54973.1 D-tagatose 3-epimerase [Caulifigura coniformis]
MSKKIRSAVTVSLVPEAKGGPFVFWDDLPSAIEEAAQLGFDGLEVFAPGPDAFPAPTLGELLKSRGLALAAVGTGAGWVKHRLLLTDPDAGQRRRAIDFVREMIEFGAAAGAIAGAPAPAIIGSMQGRWSGDTSKDGALGWLREALDELGGHAASHGSILLIEPLNRFETNLLNTLADGSALLRSLSTENVKLLADLFHMNIEEIDPASALVAAGDDIGHLHFVDSNRRPAGCGHIDYVPIAAALSKLNYRGFASAEALPWPNSKTAAERTIEVFRRVFGSSG